MTRQAERFVLPVPPPPLLLLVAVQAWQLPAVAVSLALPGPVLLRVAGSQLQRRRHVKVRLVQLVLAAAAARQAAGRSGGCGDIPEALAVRRVAPLLAIRVVAGARAATLLQQRGVCRLERTRSGTRLPRRRPPPARLRNVHQTRWGKRICASYLGHREVYEVGTRTLEKRAVACTVFFVQV